MERSVFVSGDAGGTGNLVFSGEAASGCTGINKIEIERAFGEEERGGGRGRSGWVSFFLVGCFLAFSLKGRGKKKWFVFLGVFFGVFFVFFGFSLKGRGLWRSGWVVGDFLDGLLCWFSEIAFGKDLKGRGEGEEEVVGFLGGIF